MSLQRAVAGAFFMLVGQLADAAEGPLEPFLERHCLDCHSGTKPEGGLDLTTLSRDFFDTLTLNRFVRIHDRIAKGEMPPAEVEQPTPKEVAGITRWLDAELHAADAARISKVGRARMRRMTRSEFENTLKDLLALDQLDIQSMLPEDGRVAGYDKIADGLDLSPVHLVAYTAAVEKAIDAAIATRSEAPPVFRTRLYPAGRFKFKSNLINGNFVLLDGLRPDPALPIRSGFEGIDGYVGAADADADIESRTKLFHDADVARSRSTVGILEAQLGGHEAGLDISTIFAGVYRLRFSLWAFHWNKGSVEPAVSSQALALRAHEEGRQQEGGRLLTIFTVKSLQPKEYETTAWLAAHESLVVDPVSLFARSNSIRQWGGRTAGHVGPGIAIDWFDVEGPINPTWPPPSHRRLFGDLPIAPFPIDSPVVRPHRDPVRAVGGSYLPSLSRDIPAGDRTRPLEAVQSSQPVEDARRLLGDFLPRAFRRLVTADEVEPYVALVSSLLAANDCFEDAMRRAYVAILTSPEFLFHPADAAADRLALASRLSYWLWNSPPDEPLLTAARDGRVRDPAVLHGEVDRLLDDPRSDRFIDDFTNQWLELRRIDETAPDRQLYPEYSFLLHEGMVAETRAFFRELIRHDLSASALADADFAMLTQRLAEHYGITGVDGADVRRVPVPAGSHRGGLLGQAAIHKLTANGTTTSPVKRGVWVMDRLLDDPAPPPPPGVSGVDPDTRGATTIREQLAKHRNDATCAACHAKIDPPGFALEAFDPVGGHRDRYRSTGKGDPAPDSARAAFRAGYRLGPEVDDAGQFADGRPFTGIDDFKRALASNARPLARAFTAHMIRYATGADVTYGDRRTIEQILDEAAPADYGLRTIIQALAASPLVLGAGRDP